MCQKTEWNTSKRKVISNLRMMVERQEARAKMTDNKVDGSEDAVVGKMIKQLPLEKICTITKCFRNASWVRWKLQVRGRL